MQLKATPPVPETWTARQLAVIAGAPSTFEISDDSWKAIRRSHGAYKLILESGAEIYGENTGFGPFVRFNTHSSDSRAKAQHLLAHLGAGSGPDTPELVVKAAMLLRLKTIGMGHSGTNPELVEAYLRLLHSDYVPCVPVTGSVGASGDLIPMASIAGILVGYGSASRSGQRIDAKQVIGDLGISTSPIRYARDSLSLVNCTSFSTAWAALAVVRAQALLRHAECATSHLMALVGARMNSLAAPIHRLKRHPGQQVSAANILRDLNQIGHRENPSRPLQEIYSIRCAPQLLGACRDQLDYAEVTLNNEINAVDDNPIVGQETNSTGLAEIYHGGNFFGQHIAFAADAINAAVTQIGVLVERQIDLLVTPTNYHEVPLLLAWDAGRMSGLAGLQIGASALVAEMRGQCQAYATTSIPTNAGNQDVVPMAANAARQAFEQTDRLSTLIAQLCLCVSQLNALIAEGKASGNQIRLLPQLPHFDPLVEDRPIRDEIERAAASLLEHG